jgi:murein DD-endopeptidase MepM/ murein hydrolase activator NlpD
MLKNSINYAALNPSTEYSVETPLIQASDIVDNPGIIVKANQQLFVQNKVIDFSKPFYGITIEESRTIKLKDSGVVNNATSLLNYIFSSINPLGNSSEESICIAKVYIPYLHDRGFIPDYLSSDSEQLPPETIDQFLTAYIDETKFDKNIKIPANKIVKIHFIDNNFESARIIGISDNVSTSGYSPGIVASLTELMQNAGSAIGLGSILAQSTGNDVDVTQPCSQVAGAESLIVLECKKVNGNIDKLHFIAQSMIPGGKVSLPFQGSNVRISSYPCARKRFVTQTGKLSSSEHRGFDIVISSGPAIAIADGIVECVGTACKHSGTGGGVTVILRHTALPGDPEGANLPQQLTGKYYSANAKLESYYLHLKVGSLLVSKGDIVRAGQPIATINNTGASSGAHLHFELRANDQVLFAFVPKNEQQTQNQE